MTAFKKVLIANRGEIAVRIIRTLRALAIPNAVIFHPSEGDTLAVREADEAHPMGGESPVAAYLDIESILAACRATGADAVHPGYGFLAESAAFAEALAGAGITFIGPRPEVIALMGDKVRAGRLLAGKGFPVLPAAYEEEEPATFLDRAGALGYPLLVKAAAGGGGRGMRIVREPGELASSAAAARGEAERNFGDGRLYCERYLERPRHVEVQVLGDHHGNLVHFWERECSVQRRFQKIVEESPSPALEDALRARFCEAALGIARAVEYTNAGTVEFILAEDGAFYFLEMNTRLQVEHPVTEEVTGFDLVAEQVRIAAGEPLGYGQGDVPCRGHAFECRIYAEEPEHDFAPATGKVLRLRPPAGPGVRFESGITAGQTVSPAFDPLLAKVVARGKDRKEALARARAALRELVILGVATNAAYLERLLGHPAFAAGEVSTHFTTDHAADLALPELDDEGLAPLLAAAALASRRAGPAVPEPYASMGGWRN